MAPLAKYGDGPPSPPGSTPLVSIMFNIIMLARTIVILQISVLTSIYPPNYDSPEFSYQKSKNNVTTAWWRISTICLAVLAEYGIVKYRRTYASFRTTASTGKWYHFGSHSLPIIDPASSFIDFSQLFTVQSNFKTQCSFRQLIWIRFTGAVVNRKCNYHHTRTTF